MKLLVHELKSSIYQELTPDKTTQVEAIRLHLYKHNTPAGTFYIEIQDASGEPIAVGVESITAAEISDADFYHGMIRFYINAQLRAGTTYRIVLKATGYVFAEEAYLGWCNSFDLSSYDADYIPTGNFQAALSLEVWERIII